MGNSEVGHLNIGSGRVIRMDVSLVDHEIETGRFSRNERLTHVIERARDNGKSLHLMGLLSDGQVHSSITHLYALLKLAKDKRVERVFIHARSEERRVGKERSYRWTQKEQKSRQTPDEDS